MYYDNKIDYLKRMAIRLAGEDGLYDRDAVQALTDIATNHDITSRLLECMPGPPRTTVRVHKFPDGKKITAIKLIRQITGCDLRTGKDFIEGNVTMGLMCDQLDNLAANGIGWLDVAID